MTFQTSFEGAWIPRRPLAGERTGVERQLTLKRMSRPQALKLPYIETNPTALRSLVVVDRDESDTDLIAGMLGLPEPSWVAMNRYTGSGHVVFALAAPVCLTDAGRRAPVNLLARVEQGMTDVLGGDVGYAGRITKNPHHSSHLALWGEENSLYSLRELAKALGDVGALPDRSKTGRTLQDSAVGRNVGLFELTRQWAYRARLRYSDSREWDGVVEAFAWEKNVTEIADHFAKGPMTRAEVHHLARSVSRWTWRNITPEQLAERRRQWATPERQRARSQRAAEKRMIDRKKINEVIFR